MTILAPHYRGDTFEFSFTLGNGWVGSDFTGGVKFTLRQMVPGSSTVSDDDAVDQASTADGEIVFVGAVGTVTIPAARTTSWPHGNLYWDLQGNITGPPARVYTVDSGTIPIRPDITRS